MRKLALTIVALLVCLCLGGLTLPTSSQAQSSANSPELQTLALLNQWRISEGEWPLKQNPTLAALALYQATYLSTIMKSPNDTVDYHRDGKGRYPQQRAAEEPYNWPNYGHKLQIEVGENAAIGNPAYALYYWQHSAIHKKTALSRTYREVGLAAVKLQKSLIIIAVFGSRPNIWPAQTDGARDTLYVTTEYSRYSKQKDNVTMVEVQDASGKVIVPKEGWKASIALPANTSGTLKVSLKNSGTEIIAAVNLNRDIAVLPDTLSIVANLPKPAETTVAISTAISTAINTAVNTPTPVPPTASVPTQVAVLPSPTQADSTPVSPTASASTPTPVQVATTQPSPTVVVPTVPAISPTPTIQPRVMVVTLTNTPKPKMLVLVYSDSALFLYNNTATPVNISGLVIGNATGRVTTEQWQRVAPFPADKFPAGQCVEIGLAGQASTFGECKRVRSEVTIAASKIFWRQGQFTVSRGSTLLATCDASARRCEFPEPTSGR